MPLEPTPVSWPITGGIDSKKAPLMLAPGSHLTLDNIRQERANEWRARTGFTHSVADDLLAGVAPVRAIPLIGGGMIAMDRQNGNASALQTYIPSLAAIRWNRGSNVNGSQSTPAHWSRKPVTRAKDDAPVMCGFAASPTYALVTHWGQTGGVTGIYASLQSLVEGETLPNETLISATGVFPRVVYDPFRDRLCLFWIENSTNALKIATWIGATGAPATTATTLVTNVNVISLMDALVYGTNNTATVVYRSTTSDHVRQLEVDTSTLTLSTNVDLGIAATGSLNLLPDPDTSGNRLIALSNSTPETRVLIVNAAGTIGTNSVANSTISANVCGCAYQSGAGWAVVMQQGNNLVAVKRRSGVVSAAVNLITTGSYTIDTNAWREPGTDLMRYVIGLHRPVSDAQSTYYEMALEFENGLSTVSNLFPEPQARMLPLNAGPAVQSCSQVQRLGTDKFALGLIRLARFGKQATSSANQYAIDAWSVEYANDTNRATLNIGPGLMTAVGSFLPAGNLLQSNTGGSLWAHGMSAIPFQPTLVAAAGGSLTANSQYQYVVSVDAPDEAGNVWEGPPSTPAVMTAAAMGANTQITVTVTVIPTENAARAFTYKIWRTRANGSAYQLVNSRTGTVASLGATYSFVDQVADTALISGDFLSAEIPAGITPSFLHSAYFNGRVYGVDRDFPTRIWYSKPITFGRSPEFPSDGAFVIDKMDEYGDFTNLATLDGTLAAFKGSNGTAATYAIQGDGPDNAGGGNPPSCNLISSDAGCIVGSPVVTTGDEAYFLSLLGIYRITRSLGIDFVGAPLDQFFNQPTIQTPETLTGAVYDRETNEVRLQTTNYRFVYNRIFGCWSRDTGGMPGTLMTRALPTSQGTTQLLFRSNGQMWQESATAVDDAGTVYQASLRSAWIRAAQYDGWFSLFRARLLAIRTSGGGSVSDPRFKIAFENDDTPTETFAPKTPIAANATPIIIEAGPRRQRCSAFTLEFTFPASDATFRIEQWSVVVGMQDKPIPYSPAQRWQ